MEEIRFEKFALLIDGAQKCIQRFKSYLAQELGVKSVHVLWIYELYIHPNGLTSAELAVRSNIDPSLISRELANLTRRGYITKETTPGKRTYNAPITLTDEGRALAKKIYQSAMQTQCRVNAGVSKPELETFYRVLEKLHGNLNEYTNEIEAIKENEVQENEK